MVLICWKNLSLNYNAIELLEQNKDKINNLSMNPSAIELLKQNKDEIDYELSQLPVCKHFSTFL
jgi:hypothetical protein